MRNTTRPLTEVLEARRLLCTSHAAHITAAQGDTLAIARAVDTTLVQLDQNTRAFTGLAGVPIPASAAAKPYILPESASFFDVNWNRFKKELADADLDTNASGQSMTLALPTPDGSLERFNVRRTEILQGQSAKDASYIATFIGQGIDNPAATLAMDYGSLGLHASVYSPEGSYYVDPFYLRETTSHISYYKTDLEYFAPMHAFSEDEPLGMDEHDADADQNIASRVGGPEANGAILRTYDLAIATTGEYGAFFGTADAALSAVVTSVVRLNQLYERDFAIRMQLVPQESQFIFINASTDPFTGATNPDTSNSQGDALFRNTLGAAGYDIGHIYHRGSNNGKAAGIGNVGGTGNRSGYSSFTTPIGDPFIIDYVAHEMGHQFGGRHTFNNCSGGAGDLQSYATEPGSGTTIMGYAGICTYNVQNNSDAMFQAINYITTNGADQQILSYTLTNTASPGFTSATQTQTGNNPPTVEAGLDYTIPINTPYELTSTASDSDGDTLTYSWENLSTGASAVALSTVNGFTAVPPSTATTAPLVRTRLPVASPTRSVPPVSSVLQGLLVANGETVPGVGRVQRFASVVRDNRAGAGGVGLDTMTLTSVNTGAAFSITSFNTAATYDGGSTQTLTWNVAGTTGSGINTANVDVFISLDGGATFTLLAGGIANDGSENIVLPSVASQVTNARLKIKGSGNVFYDINNANLTINTGQVSPATNIAVLANGSDTGVSNTDGITNRNNSSTNRSLSFTVGNTVAGALVELFSDGTLIGTATASGSSTLVTTNGTATITDGLHSVTARQTVSGGAASALSPVSTIIIDTTAPQISPQLLSFETEQAFTYNFNEPVAGVSLSNFTVLINPTTTTLPQSSFTLTTAPTSAQFTYNAGILPNAQFSTTLQGNITDLAGNTIIPAIASDFFLQGDANRDRSVNFNDLVILAANFNTSNKTFSQGNFNYSAGGLVDFNDLVLLAANYNTSLTSGRGIVRQAGSSFADDWARLQNCRSGTGVLAMTPKASATAITRTGGVASMVGLMSESRIA